MELPDKGGAPGLPVEGPQSGPERRGVERRGCLRSCGKDARGGCSPGARRASVFTARVWGAEPRAAEAATRTSRLGGRTPQLGTYAPGDISPRLGVGSSRPACGTQMWLRLFLRLCVSELLWHITKGRPESGGKGHLCFLFPFGTRERLLLFPAVTHTKDPVYWSADATEGTLRI